MKTNTTTTAPTQADDQRDLATILAGLLASGHFTYPCDLDEDEEFIPPGVYWVNQGSPECISRATVMAKRLMSEVSYSVALLHPPKP